MCLALTIVLLVVVIRSKGPEALLPLIMVPPMLAAFITRDRVNLFAPHGSSMKPITYLVTVILALLTVPLLGSALYGIYRAVAWLIAMVLTA